MNRTKVPLHLNGITVETWVQGSGVYTKLLANTGTAEIRAKIGHRHWPKSRGFGH